MKKIIALALALLMVLPLMMFSASAETITPDISWYDANATEFTIQDAADLLGFAQLIKAGTGFQGKTVKIANDIVLNGGDAATWANSAPAVHWTNGGTFRGTLDGQGHSISGVYCDVAYNAGLFAQAENATIKNLSIVNSYFHAKYPASAFVANGIGEVTIDTCYTDAIIACDYHNGGGFMATMVDYLETKGYFKNLWFDGSITIQDRYAGGIIANGNTVKDGPCNKIYVENCLNTGKVYTTENGNIAHIAGIVGRNDGYTSVVNCLNVGKVSSAATESGYRDTLGALVGKTGSDEMIGDTYKSHLTIKNSWASKESCRYVLGENASPDPSQVIEYGEVSEVLLKSYHAYLNTTLDFENAWAVNLDGYPIPQAFLSPDQIPPLYEVTSPVMNDAELKVDGHYGPRWTVTLDIPEGFTSETVKIGTLIVPTKAIPSGHALNLEDTAFEYRSNTYEVANVEGKILRDSDEGTLKATFVITDLDAETARMNFTAVPYVLYTTEDGNTIVMYGDAKTVSFYREMVLSLEDGDAEYQAKAETILAPIDAELGGRFPVSEVWGNEDLFEEVPALLAPDTTVLPSEDHGADNYVITVDGTTDDDYRAYLELLETYGFTKVYDNGDEGIEGTIFNAIFQKDDLTVTVTNMSYRNITTISAKWDMALSPHLYSSVTQGGNQAVTMHVNPMVRWGNSILFQLNNGHFVMNDGACFGDLPYLLDLMDSLVPAGETPVIEAWFVSHMHTDHYELLRAFAAHPEFIDRVKVNGVYISEPSDALKDLDPGTHTESVQVLEAIKLLKNQNGEATTLYRPQTGQRYYFNGMTIEVLLSQEQIPFDTYKAGTPNDFNGTSTWYRHHIGEQDVLIAGDSSTVGMQIIMESFEQEMLDFDIFFALHHGYNTWTPFTRFCTFKTLVFPWGSILHVDLDQEPNENNAFLEDKAIANGGEALHYGMGRLKFTFPYTVGQVSTTKVDLTKYRGQYHNEKGMPIE